MSEHPNVTTVNRMTQAIVDQDSETLTSLFTDDFVLHLRGPFATAGDHLGVAGILGAIGAVFEATNGDVKLEQQFCVGVDGWAAEWEHAVLGRHGETLESDNAFVYRFAGDRIAEMWMFLGPTPTPPPHSSVSACGIGPHWWGESRHGATRRHPHPARMG
jgi:ketosteroid isomerase-like protein